MHEKGFKPQTLSINEKRSLYEWLRRGYNKIGRGGAVITEGYLQFILQLGSTSLIQFNALEDGSTTPLSGENRIKRSDGFWATEHGFAITQVATVAQIDEAVPELFPNPIVFTGAVEILALRSLYFTGTLYIQIGSTVYYDNYPIGLNFEQANIAARNLAISAAVADNTIPRSEVSPELVCKELTPHVFFNGDFSNKVEIRLAESVDMTGQGGLFNFAIYRCRGFYITNGKLSSDELKALMRTK